MVRSGGEVDESACSGQFMRAPLDPEEASRLLIEGYGRMAGAYDANGAPYHAPIARRLLEPGRIGAEERVLERHRPQSLAPDVRRLREARKVNASTDEGRATQSGDGWMRFLRNAGFSAVQAIEEIHPAVFRSPDAFLDYSFAWNDNERELRHMTPEGREALRQEFRERVAERMGKEGLVMDWRLRYFVVGM